MSSTHKKGKVCWEGVLPAVVMLTVAVGVHAPAQEVATKAWAATPREVKVELANKITAPFTVAAVGDIIEPQPLSSIDPRFQALVEQFRKADVGFANMESSLVDFSHFQGPVGGTEAPLETGDAMKAMGITLVNRANNHALNGGLEGMFSTDEALDKVGIVHAGTGKDLQAARAAAYQKTPKGRVGLVGMFSVDGEEMSSEGAATYRNGDLAGAAGENVLHLTPYHVVSPEQLQEMKNIAASVYEHGATPTKASSDGPERFKYFNAWFQVGPNPGALAYEMNQKDERDILTSIRNGKIYADFMIVAIHAHQLAHFSQNALAEVDDHDPPDFLVKLAHDSVDNGADMFVVQGVHDLRGIEIYKGKPIFYDVGAFVFQFGLQFGAGYDAMANWENMSRLEKPASEESVLTTSTFDGGKLKEVRLYPVDLGGSRRPISQIGIPMKAGTEDAQRILKELQELSKPFGTTISIEDNVGVIRVNGDGQPVAAAR